MGSSSLLHRRWAREKKGGHNGDVGIDFDGCLSYGDRHSYKVDKMKKIVLIAPLPSECSVQGAYRVYAVVI